MSSPQPLELLEIQMTPKNGVHKSVPALHKTWVSERGWVSFRPPPSGAGTVSVDDWCERASFVADDLDFLLGLEHHHFWSQLVYDASLQPNLVRILQFLPRKHDLNPASGDARVAEHISRVGRKVFLVFVRLSTPREAPDKFISPGKFGELIYDNFLVDVPRIMDLCVLFRHSSPKILSKMVGSVFKHRPTYSSDLAVAASSICKSMNTIVERTDTMLMQSSCDTAELSDLVVYAADMLATVDALVQTYPPGAMVFHAEGFDTRLASFYSSCIIVLCKYLTRQRNSLPETEFSALLARLQFCRLSSVSILRQTVEVRCLEKVLAGDKSDGESGAEGYLHILTDCLAEGYLLLDYAKANPIADDIELFGQAGIELDPTRVQYILDGIRSLAVDLNDRIGDAEAKNFQVKAAKDDVAKEKAAEKEAARKRELASREQQRAGAGPSGVELDSLISQVRELLPDLGSGFVEACLEYFDHDPERVINSLLEENLPPHLMELDRQTARKKKETPGPARSNVFDGDEFDVNSRDRLDMDRVHKGKHSMSKVAKNANALLEDKRDLEGLKDRFAKLSVVTDVVYLSKEDSAAAGDYDNDDEYDDEYDDTYDDNAVGQEEPDAADADRRRPFVLPRALGGGHVQQERQRDKGGDESAEEGEDEARKKNNDFVRNPAEVREERERKWRESNRGRGGAPKGNRDVVGRAKGQGQDKKVLIDRSRKNANKNKQHRAAADRKQAKGMF